MPVTISGDAYKRIEALAAGLSDERLRDLTIQLRDSLVGTLRSTKWGASDIGRGLTQYTEPVRTATGGWIVGVGSLEILHREPAPPHTIKDFLEWYRGTYRPAEKERRAAEKAIKAKTAKEAARLQRVNVELFGAYREQVRLLKEMSQLRDDIIILERDIIRLRQPFPTSYALLPPGGRARKRYDELKAKRPGRIRAKQNQITKKKATLEKKGKRLDEATAQALFLHSLRQQRERR